MTEPRAAERYGWLATAGVALGLRLALATLPLVNHPDEIWQYLEPAYGIVTGRWIETWEFHAHIRGWLIPMLLVPPVAIGHWLAPASQLHIWLVRLVLALASLGIVVAAAMLGARSGRLHALVAAWVAAIWPEIVYFASRSSAEAIALSLLLPAIALLYRLKERPAAGTAFAAGFLLLLGVIARFQYLPAVALIAVWGAADHCRRVWKPLLLGNAAALALGGLADLGMGEAPFSWGLRNYATNMIASRSALFGTSPPGWYFTTIGAIWGWSALALVPLIALGARRLPMLAACAGVLLATHMLVPHKEYRFVLLAVALLVLLAAIGSADAALWLTRRRPSMQAALFPALATFWLGLAIAVGAGEPFRDFWSIGHDALIAEARAGEIPGVCGIAFYRIGVHPRASHALVNRPVPLLLIDGPIAQETAAANRDRFNVAIAPRLAGASLPAAYRLAGCPSPDVPRAQQGNCLFLRPGGCRGGAGDFDYGRALTRLGH